MLLSQRRALQLIPGAPPPQALCPLRARQGCVPPRRRGARPSTFYLERQDKGKGPAEVNVPPGSGPLCGPDVVTGSWATPLLTPSERTPQSGHPRGGGRGPCLLVRTHLKPDCARCWEQKVRAPSSRAVTYSERKDGNPSRRAAW